MLRNICRLHALTRCSLQLRNCNSTSVQHGESLLSSANLDEHRRRVLYRSRKRGIREMDFILGKYADARLTSMSDADLETYEQLIDGRHNEWDMYYWITGARDVPKEVDSLVLRDIIAFAKNTDIRQPPLIDPKKKCWPTGRTFYASKPSVMYNQRDDMFVMWHPKQQHRYEHTLPIDEEQMEADRLKREEDAAANSNASAQAIRGQRRSPDEIEIQDMLHVPKTELLIKPRLRRIMRTLPREPRVRDGV